MSESQFREMTRDWLESFWNEVEARSSLELIHPDGEFLGWGRSVQGSVGWLQMRERFHAAFDALEVTVIDLIGQESEVSGHARFAARHRKSDREVDVFFSFFVRWKEGKVAWMRSLLDTSSLMAQLNLLDLKRWDVVLEP